jgi:hypothetical protein
LGLARLVLALVAGLLGLIAISSGTAGATSPVVLYAAPNGTGASCASTAPCSLLNAQARVRQINQHMSADIEVQLLGGTYRLIQPLTFGPSDSGTDGYRVIYQAAPGQPVVLSGGIPLAGWHKTNAQKDIWTTSFPAGLDTRQLYVNGLRAPRSTGMPNISFLQTSTGFIASSPLMASWRNPSDIELVFTGGAGAWTQTRCGIAKIVSTTITMQQPCWANLHLPDAGTPVSQFTNPPQGGFYGIEPTTTPTAVENAFELLTPGHFYLDHSANQIDYIPLANQDMSTASVVAPILQTLVQVKGTLSDPVHDLTFSGLQFSYATWTGPDTGNGFVEMQANFTLTGPGAATGEGTCTYETPHGSCPYAAWTRTPANVVLSAAHDVTLSGDRFEHLGGAGLDIEYGSQGNLVQGNEFTDISGSAIQLGDTHDPLPADVGANNSEINSGNSIVDNYIHNVAAEYAGGIGIWVGYTQHTLISHNQIDDLPYSGISIGWGGWHTDVSSPNTDANVNADNVISDNLIYEVMKYLGDGGAIYANGPQATNWTTALVLAGNIAYGNGNADFTYYTDTGSKYIKITDNAEYDERSESFSTGGCHTIGHIKISYNYFAQLGPVYPCYLVTDIETSDNQTVCNALWPNQIPNSVLANAGLEPAYRNLVTSSPPTLTGIGPSSVPPSGGLVVLSGSGFTPSTSVTFAGRPALSVEVLSANYLLARAPAGTGDVRVGVTTPSGTTSAPSGLSYQSFPAICPVNTSSYPDN